MRSIILNTNADPQSAPGVGVVQSAQQHATIISSPHAGSALEGFAAPYSAVSHAPAALVQAVQTAAPAASTRLQNVTARLPRNLTARAVAIKNGIPSLDMVKRNTLVNQSVSQAQAKTRRAITRITGR